MVFRLQDFLKEQNKSNNQYQLVKTKHFLQKLQTGILITSFSDAHFQSLVAVPLVTFNKVQKFWVGRVWLSQELFHHKYPFNLPDLFKHKLNKYHLEVRAHVFKIFLSKSFYKTIALNYLINRKPK